MIFLLFLPDLQPALTERLGPDFCPQVVEGAEILIPAGVSRGFNVSAKNLPEPPAVSFILWCEFVRERPKSGS